MYLLFTTWDQIKSLDFEVYVLLAYGSGRGGVYEPQMMVFVIVFILDPTYDLDKPNRLRNCLALAACNDGKILEELLKREDMRYT